MQYRVIYVDDALSHHGILGQKWGIRRYQNPDGTLTDAGKKRYGSESGLYKSQAKKEAKKSIKDFAKFAGAAALTAGTSENVAVNMTANLSKAAYNVGKILNSGYGVVSSNLAGAQAAAHVATFMAQYGSAVATATTVAAFAAGGYAVYRAAKAGYKTAKAYKAKKEGR